MTHYVHVVGQDADQAEEWIRQQNDNARWPKHTEFITVTNADQLPKGNFTLVTLDGWDMAPNGHRFTRLIGRVGITWLHG